MHTLIEVIDADQIMNLYGSLSLKPEKTIFLYAKKHEYLTRNKIIHEKLHDQIEYREYTRENLVAVLDEIETEDREIGIDIHGGDDFVLAILSQWAYQNHCALYYPDLRRGRMLKILDNSVETYELDAPHLSVKEAIELYGGAVIDFPEEHYEGEGRKLVMTCQKLRHANSKYYAAFVNQMMKVRSENRDKTMWSAHRSVYERFHYFFEQLEDMFHFCGIRNGRLEIDFKDESYKHMITDNGITFEYDTYYQIRDAKAFDDIDLRVDIDWNGGKLEYQDPRSEIDCVATKDGRLISISCKAGSYGEGAIYEVQSNARRFGGRRCVPVLCSDSDSSHPDLVKKASELGVLLIEAKDMRAGKCAERILHWMNEH